MNKSESISIRKKKIAEYDKRRRMENPEKIKHWKLLQRLRGYGLTYEEYLKEIEKCGNSCTLCNKPASESKYGKLVVDHCHKTKKYRGMLCSQCNLCIGGFKDNVKLLFNTICYLTGQQFKRVPWKELNQLNIWPKR